jgi:hypothetical protein
VGGSLAQKEHSGRQRRALSEGKAQGRYLSFRPDAEWVNLDSVNIGSRCGSLGW